MAWRLFSEATDAMPFKSGTVHLEKKGGLRRRRRGGGVQQINFRTALLPGDGWRAGRIEGIKKKENAMKRKRGGRLNMHSTLSKS